MSQENVDIVRWFFQVLERAFDAYWRSPRSIAAAVEAQDLWPEWREAFECVHPDYRPSLEEVADLGGDQVFASSDSLERARTADCEWTHGSSTYSQFGRG